MTLIRALLAILVILVLMLGTIAWDSWQSLIDRQKFTSHGHEYVVELREQGDRTVLTCIGKHSASAVPIDVRAAERGALSLVVDAQQSRVLVVGKRRKYHFTLSPEGLQAHDVEATERPAAGLGPLRAR